MTRMVEHVMLDAEGVVRVERFEAGKDLSEHRQDTTFERQYDVPAEVHRGERDGYDLIPVGTRAYLPPNSFQ